MFILYTRGFAYFIHPGFFLFYTPGVFLILYTRGFAYFIHPGFCLFYTPGALYILYTRGFVFLLFSTEPSEEFLFYAKKTYIVRYDIKNRNSVRIQLNGLRNVISLDYDYAGHTLFYADVTLDKIMRLNISSGKRSIAQLQMFYKNNVVVFFVS